MTLPDDLQTMSQDRIILLVGWLMFAAYLIVRMLRK